MLVSNMYRHSSKIHALEVILLMFINPLSSAYYLPQRYRSNLPVPSEFCQAVKMESGFTWLFPMETLVRTWAVWFWRAGTWGSSPVPLDKLPSLVMSAFFRVTWRLCRRSSLPSSVRTPMSETPASTPVFGTYFRFFFFSCFCCSILASGISLCHLAYSAIGLCYGLIRKCPL